MAKQEKTKKNLIGGEQSNAINPLGLARQYRAVCVTEHKTISPAWRNTRGEAEADAASHVAAGHFVDFEVRIR